MPVQAKADQGIERPARAILGDATRVSDADAAYVVWRLVLQGVGCGRLGVDRIGDVAVPAVVHERFWNTQLPERNRPFGHIISGIDAHRAAAATACAAILLPITGVVRCQRWI